MGKLRIPSSFMVLLLTATSLTAAPLSKSKQIDFFRDVTSRLLQGAATRSDGHLLSGPAVSTLKTDLGNELLWCLASDGDNLLIGTGPNGRILSLNPNLQGTIEPKVELELPDNHIFAVARLVDGTLLAGTSPQGSLVVSRNGKVIARVILPVGSVLDINTSPAKTGSETIILVATGNPGRIYRVNISKLIKAGISPEILTTKEELADHGIVLWGSVRDDNIRRLVRLPDGRIIAGSAPKGNVYAFPAKGGSPAVLAEYKNAEVTDILPWTDGFFAAVTYTNNTRAIRMIPAPPPSAKPNKNGKNPHPDTGAIIINPPLPMPLFHGRSQLVWFPDDGYPEVVATRNNSAFYRLAQHDGYVLITGGEKGELFGYDPLNRRSLTFPAGTAAQVNAIVPAMHVPGAYYAIGNNPSSIELIRFTGAASQSAKTKRIDLGRPSLIGALIFDHPITFPADNLEVAIRASVSSDELEGWSKWQPAKSQDGAWRVSDLRGRFVQLRFKSDQSPFELSGARLYYLPQNHRPQLQSFRVLSPNYALIPAVPHPNRPSTTLAQIVKTKGKGDANKPDGFLSSEVVPQPGTQVVFWNAVDPDGDNLVSTFSIQADTAATWADLLIERPASYAQFEISHLPEGLYHTRLVIAETNPRPLAQRLSTTIITEDFVVDRTPPEILEAGIAHSNHRLTVTVRAKDERTLLSGVEINFNNGSSFDLEQPMDGILDGREETFAMTFSDQQISGSTTVEVVVLDQSDNSSARRLILPVN